MKRIREFFLRFITPEPANVYVVCRAEDGSVIKDIEVYTDERVASQRQTQLGRGDTCVAERLIDDSRWARRPTARRIRGVAA